MSYNSFPIPDILDRLKEPKVDDAIHDIAERKHVFEGPMRLSPGRVYLAVLGGYHPTDNALNVNLYLGPVSEPGRIVSYLSFNQTNHYSYTICLIVVDENGAGIISFRGSNVDYMTRTGANPLITHLDNSSLSLNVDIGFANLEDTEFFVVEV